MEKMLYTKVNKVVIIMTVVHFIILPALFILSLFNSLILYVYFFYVLIYTLIRYVTLIKNFNALFFKYMEKLNTKLILYGNLCSFIIYMYILTTSLNLSIFTMLNFLLLLPEIVMTTIFNVPVLYRATTFTFKNKITRYIVKY